MIVRYKKDTDSQVSIACVLFCKNKKFLKNVLTLAFSRLIIGVASNKKSIQKPKTKNIRKTTPQKTTTTRRWLFSFNAFH